MLELNLNMWTTTNNYYVGYYGIKRDKFLDKADLEKHDFLVCYYAPRARAYAEKSVFKLKNPQFVLGLEMPRALKDYARQLCKEKVYYLGELAPPKNVIDIGGDLEAGLQLLRREDGRKILLVGGRIPYLHPGYQYIKKRIAGEIPEKKYSSIKEEVRDVLTDAIPMLKRASKYNRLLAELCEDRKKLNLSIVILDVFEDRYWDPDIIHWSGWFYQNATTVVWDNAIVFDVLTCYTSWIVDEAEEIQKIEGVKID